MTTYTIHFTRSLGEDTGACPSLPRLMCPSNRAAFVAQLRREFNECSTHLIGSGRSAFKAVTLSFHRMARNGDTYGIVGRIESPMSKRRLRAALQGLYDRGMAGEFVIVS